MSLPDKRIMTSMDLFNLLPGGLIAFEDNGTIRIINDFLLQLLDYKNEELTGNNIEIIFSLSSNIFYQTHLFPLLQLKGSIEEIFLSLKSSNGKSIPVLLYGKKVYLDGRILNIWELLPVWQRKKYEEEILEAKKTAEKTIEDNADLRRTKEELEIKAEQLDRQILRLSQINDEYAAFSKVISHDLQEPIRKIHLFTDILRQSHSYTEADHVQFERIHNSVNRLASLTECLDRYVSVDTIREQPRSIALHDVIEAARAQAVVETGFSDFDFIVDQVPVVEGHPGLLTQLFFELLKNAIQYRHTNRRLVITLSSVIAQYNHFRVSENKYKYIDFVKLSINDNGTGFDDQYGEYVFQMFRRLDFQSPGLGFGLPFAKKIVDKHFGTITASGQKGRGSTFHVLLPLKIHEA